MFLDWLLKTEEDNISYDELKMLAQPAIWAEYYSSISLSNVYYNFISSTGIFLQFKDADAANSIPDKVCRRSRHRRCNERVLCRR